MYCERSLLERPVYVGEQCGHADQRGDPCPEWDKSGISLCFSEWYVI